MGRRRGEASFTPGGCLLGGQVVSWSSVGWCREGWAIGILQAHGMVLVGMGVVGRCKFQMPFAKFYRRGYVSWELHSRNKGGFFEAPGSGESGTEWEVIGWTGGRKRFITEKGKCARMIRGAN